MSMIKMKYLTLLLVLAVVRGTDAATYVVGDSLGWTIPSGGAATYTAWASQHTYASGDILVFNFAAGAHSVATVTKAAYDSCSSTAPLTLQTISPANVTLSNTGAYYFICTFGTHCSLGQKLTVTVASGSATSPAASPPTAAATPPTASKSPPTAPTSPPTSAPTMSPPVATPPPTMAPTVSPTASPPATPPTSVSPALAPGPGSMAGGGPSASPSQSPSASGQTSTAPPPGTPSSGPSPAGDTGSNPAPSSASRGAVATLAMGLGLVVFMGVVC